MQRIRTYIFLILTGVAAFTGCGLVDEDLSNCETDYRMDYELRLVADIKAEIETQLEVVTDQSVSQALNDFLSRIFLDKAYDVDLGFYDVVRDEAAGDSLRLHHETHVLEDNQTSFTLYIPIRDYRHLAVANLYRVGDLSFDNAELCHGARLSQLVRDTVPCHAAGLFTAREDLIINQETADQHFDVTLYMANSATALVVDTLGSGVRSIRAYAEGFATGLNLCDSTYVFDYSPVVRAETLPLENPGYYCFTTVNFPSRDSLTTTTKADTDDSDPEKSLWRYYVYTEMPDGTVTLTILGIHSPLEAGHLKIIEAKVQENGSVQPGDATIGVSVVLDWQDGYNVEVPLE